jgi:hypothetical protein
VILQTIKKAGFENWLGFGPHASFLAATTSKNNLKFNYNSFPEEMELSARVNTIEILDEKSIQKSENEAKLNSIFWPRGL